MVQGISEDRYGIGYSGIGYITSGVVAVPLAKKGTKNYSKASLEEVLKGRYPLGRFLYIYINKAPNKPLDPLTGEFVKFILSKEGQMVVTKDGYDQLPLKVIQKQLNVIE